MPTAKKACKFIRDLTDILVECRAFAGEVVFTAAAFYGLYHALRLLIRLGRPHSQLVHCFRLCFRLSGS